MRTADVLAHFRNKAELARRLGLSRSSISSWGELVPPKSAADIAALPEIRKLNDPRLKYNPEDYKGWNGAGTKRPRTARRTAAAETETAA
jgi:hypothetical protein